MVWPDDIFHGLVKLLYPIAQPGSKLMRMLTMIMNIHMYISSEMWSIELCMSLGKIAEIANDDI